MLSSLHWSRSISGTSPSVRHQSVWKQWIKNSATFTRLPTVVRTSPGLVGVVAIHVLHDLEGIAAKVLLVNSAFVADHESVDSSDPVLGRRRDQRKASEHCSLDYEVEPAKSRSVTLAFQYLEIVTVERRRLIRRVALFDGPCDRFADRTSGRAVIVLPI